MTPASLVEIREATVVFGRVRECVATFDFGESFPNLRLEVIVRSVYDSPVFRFGYRLTATEPLHLTKPDGVDALSYFTLDFARANDYGDPISAKEIRFAEFNSLFHSFMLSEAPLGAKDFAANRSVVGPFLVVGAEQGPSGLVAYEHGSQSNDPFLTYDLQPTGTAATLRAVKGNYWHGQTIAPESPYETPWFQVALVDGNEDALAEQYRTWVLQHQSPNGESRKPYVFYNTWNYQERVFNQHKKPYLSEMNETRMLAEIEAAHEMGIEVFVIDTGWYDKTGDWRVSSERFPNGLAPINKKLDEYGMKLGLWFNPIVAAMSSEMYQNYSDCVMTKDGKPDDPHEVWETEPSYSMSLVSRYWEAFADGLIRCHAELGVTYFKWDAIGQYGGDGANLFHGGSENSAKERRDCYGFLLGRYMTKVVDKLCAACPDAIVDFDITEGARTVGLQFLSAGKYFLINNGPYNHDFNMPVPADGNVNLFFYPGPARTWICRAPLNYDRWIPSVLFLTHYLPDDTHPAGWSGKNIVDGENQWLAIASLVLGQNGIWGDLCAVSEAGRERFRTALGWYKQVRDDVTLAAPVRIGNVGGSPEVHEKIHRATGRGVVSIFAASSGTYSYVTEGPVVESVRHNHGIVVSRLADGRAVITSTFAPNEHAKVLFFGAE
jgi:alpha-galactosidase